MSFKVYFLEASTNLFFKTLKFVCHLRSRAPLPQSEGNFWDVI